MKLETCVWCERYPNVGWVSPKGVTQQGGSDLLGYAALLSPLGGTQPTWLISGKLSVEQLDIQFPAANRALGELNAFSPVVRARGAWLKKMHFL